MKRKMTQRFIAAHVGYTGRECLIWPYGRDSLGYARATMPGFTTRLAHRIILELAKGPSNGRGDLARHTCGKGHLGCVNPRHLEWGTAKDNSTDAEMHGSKLYGEYKPTARLNAEKVKSIRQMLDEGQTQARIAMHFEVSPGAIQAISDGRTWGHIA